MMTNKKLNVWLPLLLSLMMIIGMIIGFQLHDKTNSAVFLSSGKKPSIVEVLDLIKERYVDKEKQDSVTQEVIDDLLSHLDPHSLFIPSKFVTDVNEDLMGNFQGIGIEYQIFNDTVNIVNVIKNGPGEKAGLQVGDKLITVNDTTLSTGKALTTNSIKQNLRGPSGTSVKLAFLRDKKLITTTIVRDNIPVPTIDAAYILDNNTGYIKIAKFGDRTYEEFMQSLENLQKKGMKKLVLDVRGNPGGLMNVAIAIADEFLDNDKLIVYTQGDQSLRMDYKCKKEGLFETGSLVVLIDENSASASEVLSGALQDWDRATIIGRRSFGKGLVQQQFQLTDGSAVRLTVARYYTPLGRNIQKPYSNKSKKDYEEDLMNRYHDGELVREDSISNKGKAYRTPNGHTVYGGGGITPDIFVPIDTNKTTVAYTRLYFRNSLNQFVYQYYLAHKSTLQPLTTVLQLQNTFKPGTTEWEAFKSVTLMKDGINLNEVTEAEKNKILFHMQTLIARLLFHNEGYYEILNQKDNMVLKAMEVVKK